MRARIVGRSIIGVLNYGGSSPAPATAESDPGAVLREPYLASKSIGEHAVNVWVSPPGGDPETTYMEVIVIRASRMDK